MATSAAVDYYEILGVSEASSVEEIRKAYIRLALIHHPDKQPAHERENSTRLFQLIAEAYETLSEPSSRQQYDMQRRVTAAPVSGAGFVPHHHMDPFTLFSQMFAAGGPFGAMFSGASPFQGGGGGGGGSGDPARTATSSFGGAQQAAHGGGYPFATAFMSPFPAFGTLGGAGGMASFQSFSSGGSGGGWVGQRSSSSTSFENGRQITRRRTTRSFPDGRSETTNEVIVDGAVVSSENDASHSGHSLSAEPAPAPSSFQVPVSYQRQSLPQGSYFRQPLPPASYMQHQQQEAQQLVSPAGYSVPPAQQQQQQQTFAPQAYNVPLAQQQQQRFSSQNVAGVPPQMPPRSGSPAYPGSFGSFPAPSRQPSFSQPQQQQYQSYIQQPQQQQQQGSRVYYQCQ